MVTSKEDTFVFSNSSSAENVKVCQDDRPPNIHVTRAERTKFHSKSTGQDNVNVGNLLNPAVSLLEAEVLQTFLQFFGGVSIFSRGLWLDAAERNNPRVFRVQRGSSFARRWRHVEATACCTEMLLVFKASAFHRRSSRWMPGKLATASVPCNAQPVVKQPSEPRCDRALDKRDSGSSEVRSNGSRVTGHTKQRRAPDRGATPEAKGPPEGRGTARSPQRKHNRPKTGAHRELTIASSLHWKLQEPLLFRGF